jgi:DNA helicase-2/ATP-dependent DNA helicase PcrA
MPTIEELLHDHLTDDQVEAATDTANEVLTIACAGSGKSRTLAFRIAWLVTQGADPKSIVAFTFTEKAADTIKRRVASALVALGMQPTILGAMYVGTMHAYCQHVLGEMDTRYRQFDVLDENRLKLYLMSRFPQLGISPLRDRARNRSYFDTIRRVADAWKTMHDEMIELLEITRHDRELGEVLQAIEQGLYRDQFIDFSLMIRSVVSRLQRAEAGGLRFTNTLRHLLVDEYQDVNPCQERLIRLLHEHTATLFVVGDDDQSIYGWRGANVNNILTFQDDDRYPHARRHTLAANFRSTTAIVTAAETFIARELGPARLAKNPRAAGNRFPRDLRVTWFANRAAEAEWVAERIMSLLGTAYEEENSTTRGLTPADFAILMRSTREPEQNQEPRHAAFTQALKDRGILFSLEAGGGPFDRPQARILRETFELLRENSPTRMEVEALFNDGIADAFPNADLNATIRVLSAWGRQVHAPMVGARRRVYPQQLVHDLLKAFGLPQTEFSPVVMRDIGLFSRMIQDVESVYMSVDSPHRFQDILNFLHHVAESGYDVSTDDILLKPDAVTVATVHKVKGLEFPVVFIVDAEGNRFPGRMRQYDGWLPDAIIRQALDRGAYRSTQEEEARLFFTAATRAETYLYVTGSALLPGGKSARKPSRFTGNLVHPELATDSTVLPAGLQPALSTQRTDETLLPTSFSAIRYYLQCPRSYQMRESFGFSPPIPEMFGFGKTVHTAIERLHELFTNHPPTPVEAENVASDTFHLKHVPASREPDAHPGPYERAKNRALTIAVDYANTYAADFLRQRQVEARFEIPVQNAVISGSIDLLLEEDERGNIVDAEVIDFKAIEGGIDPEHNPSLDWTDLALQVQLYAHAAREVIGVNAQTGAVHVLKDNQRVNVPIDDDAISCALRIIEWAVGRILARDFPMRPHHEKCEECDFKCLCSKTVEQFQTDTVAPPPIHVPGNPGIEHIRAFSRCSALQ